MSFGVHNNTPLNLTIIWKTTEVLQSLDEHAESRSISSQVLNKCIRSKKGYASRPHGLEKRPKLPGTSHQALLHCNHYSQRIATENAHRLRCCCIQTVTNTESTKQAPISTIGRLAYGGCACNTSGSLNRAVSPEWHDNSLYFVANKNKDNSKVTLSPFNTYLDLSGSNLTRNSMYVQNNTIINLPGDTRRTISELPDAGDHFGR